MNLSVVTPTLNRPREVLELLDDLSSQSVLPDELLIIDGAPPEITDTQDIIPQKAPFLPFKLRYFRQQGGTAIQRNVGIDHAQGEFIAFVDDDIRLEPDFFEIILDAFKNDTQNAIGGISGYITNQYLDPATSRRWKWNRRLHLYTTFEPGRYDYQTGYPVNRYLQPPHDQLREIDFMGAGCAVWRKEVFSQGLRFSNFFTGLGVLEDAHLALRAARSWKLIECGKARCVHLHSPNARENARLISRKTVLNYRFVFMDIVPKRTFMQEFRFWRNQVVEVLRLFFYAGLHFSKPNWESVLGKLEGMVLASKLKNKAGILEIK